MKKQHFMTFLTTILLISQLFITNTYTAEAKSIDDVEKEIKKLEQEQKKLNEDEKSVKEKKSETNKKIEENKAEQSSVQSELDKLMNSIETTEKDISSKESEIASLQNEISSLQENVTEIENKISDLEDEIVTLNENIDEITKRMEDREELLNERLRSMQSNGLGSYLEVIFGARSFTDLIGRVTAVNTIMNQDQQLIAEHQNDKAELESNIAQVEDNKTKLNENKDELIAQKEEIEEHKQLVEAEKENLVGLKQQLAEQSKEKEVLLAELQKEEENLLEYELTLEEEQEVLAAQASAFEKEIKRQQSKKNELEQLAKENTENNSSGGNDGNQGSGPSTPGKDYNPSGEKIFIRPALGRFTSGYGWRFHPIDKKWKFHNGLDIANSSGTPIHAAAPGTVSFVGVLDGYGNTIVISHYINGNKYSTLYAHLSGSNVNINQSVDVGQQIGTMGSTGKSTGPHLHFEVYPGGYDKGNRNDPNKYLIQPF